MTAALAPASSYREARLVARGLAGQQSAAAAGRIEDALRAYAARLGAQLTTLPLDQATAVAASRTIILEAADQLHARLLSAVQESRRLAFREVLEVWEEAGHLAAAASSAVPLAALGRVRAPAVTLAGAYESLGGAAATWRTRLTGYAQAAASDADTIVRTALLEGVSVDELARRLRPYVAGAKPFYEAFAGEGFAKVREQLGQLQLAQGPLREAGRKLRAQSHRIAYSEVWNARAEAELQHFAVDPLISFVRWRLSPFRGQLGGPDVCDSLALSDLYGLGPGGFPLHAVPGPPHPYDRCEREPQLRDPAEAHLPKPQPSLKANALVGAKLFDPSRYQPGILTAAQAAKQKAQLADLIAFSSQQEAQQGLTQLLQEATGLAATVQVPVAIDLVPLAAAEVAEAQAAAHAQAAAQLAAQEAAAAAEAAAQVAALAEGQAAKVAAAELAEAQVKAAAAEAAAGVKLPAPPAVAAPVDAEVILGEQLAGPTGSNTAGPSGRWLGTDGVTRYVKQYADEGQAYAEHLANTIYRRLGLAVPESGTALHEGKVLFWSRYLDDVEGTLGTAGLTEARAQEVLRGFAADVLTANYDAVGTGLDNVVRRAGGQLVRIDQGGSFLWRAQGKRKAKEILGLIQEWENLAKPGVNAYYAKVFQAAGLAGGDALGAQAVAQIDAILALRTQAGSWAALVDEVAPGLVATDRKAIVAMLEDRTALLEAKRAQLVEQLSPALPATPASAVTPPVVTPTPAALETVYPPPLGTTANEYVEQLVTAGTYTPEEILIQVQGHYPKTIFKLTDVEKKFVKLKVPKPTPTPVEPAPALASAAPPPPAPAPAPVAPVVPEPLPTPAAPVTPKPPPVPKPKPPPLTAPEVAQAFTQTGIAGPGGQLTAAAIEAAPEAAEALGTALADLRKGKLEALHTLKALGGSPDALQQAFEAAIASPMKAAGMTEKSLAKLGVTFDPQTFATIKAYPQQSKKVFLRSVARALAGDGNALDALKLLGADTTQLEQLAAQAAKKGAAKAKPLAKLLPKPVGPAPITGTPVHALPYQIEVDQVAGFAADSQVPQPLYFQSGKTVGSALEGGAIDVTKAAQPTFGHGFYLELEPDVLKFPSSTYKQFALKAEKTLQGTDKELKAMVAKLGKDPAAVRQALLDKGYDAIVVTDAGGKPLHVIALKPEQLKLVKVVVKPKVPPPPPPAPGAAPRVTNVSGPALRPKALSVAEQATARRADAAAAKMTEAVATELRDGARGPLRHRSAAHGAAQRARASFVDAELKVEFGDRAAGLRKAWDQAFEEWYRSSDSGGAAVLKGAAERVSAQAPTTYHGRFFDSDAALRARYFEAPLKQALQQAGLTLEEAEACFRADAAFNRALLRRLYPTGKITVRRGVGASFFHDQGLAIPQRGESLVLGMNPVSSFSLKEPWSWSGITLVSEVSIDDVAHLYFTTARSPAGYFNSEREIWIIGRPMEFRVE